jgi:hypothetical protein
MPDEKDREESRIADDLAEQEDLNQGMDTGTHESTRLGVNWPASYRRKLVPDDKSGNSTVETNAKTSPGTPAAMPVDDD